MLLLLLGELRFGSLLVVITRYQVLALFASVSANLFATVAMGNVNKVEAKHGKELLGGSRKLAKLFIAKQWRISRNFVFCLNWLKFNLKINKLILNYIKVSINRKLCHCPYSENLTKERLYLLLIAKFNLFPGCFDFNLIIQ